ncbi:aminotransferase [Kockiozyma suomiensis]|uniref:aminotransferase n=1 Tax=Kockiozyma suomiensis TaxID=1337062 RepID=UPI003343C392
MLIANWNKTTGWGAPSIVPYAPLALDPASSVLHYATECFEGMKAYRNKRTGKVCIFRPELNARRMNKSCDRVSLPTFDETEFVKLVQKFTAVEKRYLAWQGEVEMTETDDSDFLYLRPMMIGTSARLGVTPPNDAMFLIIASRLQSYNSKPLRLLAPSPEEAVRAWPGGFGNAKVGGNYGPTMKIQTEAAKMGYDQILWLFDAKRRLVTEAGAANFFVVWTTPKGTTEIVTCPLTEGIVLEGVTRQSVLDLARERLAGPSFNVVEREFSIDEIVKAADEGRLIEAFACGTAYFIAPVELLGYEGRQIEIPLKMGTSGFYAQTIRRWLEEIMYGETEHQWAVTV